MSALVEMSFTTRASHQATEALRSSTLSHLRRIITREQRKLGDFDRLLQESSWADQFRLWGQALLVDPGSVPAESSVVQLAHPSGADEVLQVPLDSDLTAVENAERYFSRARRAERAAQEVGQMADRSRRQIEMLQELLTLLIDAADGAEVKRLASLIPGTGFGSDTGPRAAGSEQAGAASTVRGVDLPPGIRRIMAPSGHEILYGRSSTDNDYLTTRIARPNDWWLHVRGDVSAHVVIRTNNQPERVPQATLMAAAVLAAAHSPSKHSSYVPVDYTLRKYVVKRRGSAPGSVQYRAEKTLHVHPTSSP